MLRRSPTVAPSRQLDGDRARRRKASRAKANSLTLIFIGRVSCHEQVLAPAGHFVGEFGHQAIGQGQQFQRDAASACWCPAPSAFCKHCIRSCRLESLAAACAKSDPSRRGCCCDSSPASGHRCRPCPNTLCPSAARQGRESAAAGFPPAPACTPAKPQAILRWPALCYGTACGRPARH